MLVNALAELVFVVAQCGVFDRVGGRGRVFAFFVGTGLDAQPSRGALGCVRREAGRPVDHRRTHLQRRALEPASVVVVQTQFEVLGVNIEDLAATDKGGALGIEFGRIELVQRTTKRFFEQARQRALHVGIRKVHAFKRKSKQAFGAAPVGFLEVGVAVAHKDVDVAGAKVGGGHVPAGDAAQVFCEVGTRGQV